MRAIGRIGHARLAVEIGANGHATAVMGGVAFTRRERPPSASESAGSNPAPSPTHAYDSKLEEARHRYLGMLQLAKDVRRVVHHPFVVPLSEKRSYTPDFLIEWADGRIQVEEVKGSLKQKNARDSITRLHVAAAKLPMFDWRLTRRMKGEWEERPVAGRRSHSPPSPDPARPRGAKNAI